MSMRCKTRAAKQSRRLSVPAPNLSATVSMPLTWKQIEKGVKISDFTIENVPALIKKSNPWKDFLQSAQQLKL